MKDELSSSCRHGFLAGLSHELRDSLAALSNSLYVLKKFLPEDARSIRAVAVVDRQIRHMTALVDSVTEVTSPGRGEVQAHVDLSGELPHDVPPVPADSTRPAQVYRTRYFPILARNLRRAR